MNPSTALARVLVSELVHHGVGEVVLAPGSRNAPLALALNAADAAGDLRLHVRVDERSAGFLALGLARGSGRPVPVVTTSGTAVANLHPAVLEAHHDGVPLVVLSADRPASMRGIGANQTIDQTRMFGSATRLDLEIPAPVEAAGQVAFWRSALSRALIAAAGTLTGDPGPVQVDVAFVDPLVPGQGPGAWAEELDPRGGPWVTAAAPADPAGTPVPEGPWAEDVPRTLVVVGADVRGARAAWVDALAADRGWPVVAEPGSAVTGRVVAGAQVAESLSNHPVLWPARVLLVGRPTLHRGVRRLLTGRDAPVDTLVLHGSARPGWPDPESGARSVTLLGADPAAPAPGLGTVEAGWRALWADAGAAVVASTADLLGTDVANGTGLAAAAGVLAGLPDGSSLVLGSSSVVRDVDLCGVALPERVLLNRGVAGIDGTVSTAVGVALAPGGSADPVVALMGDLTFLHDTNGLLIGPEEPRPDLTVVVLNDDGGGIFGLLEQGAPEHEQAFERVFGTPHGTDLAALCRAHGVAHRVLTDPADFAPDAPGSGITVVEVPIARDRHRDLHQQLRQAASTAISGRVVILGGPFFRSTSRRVLPGARRVPRVDAVPTGADPAPGAEPGDATATSAEGWHTLLVDEPLWLTYGLMFLGRTGAFGADIGAAFAGQVNGLLGAAAPDVVVIRTGLHTGYARFTVELRHAPDDSLIESWEDVVEASFLVGDDSIDLYGLEGGTPNLQIPPGSYRLRLHATGMDGAHLAVAEPMRPDAGLIDAYRLVLWPAPPAPDAVLRQTSRVAARMNERSGGS